MTSDIAYDLSLPILQDDSIEEEDKTEKLEELIRKETSLVGKELESAVLDVLWRFRNAATPSTSSGAARHTVIRRASPAPWQISRSGTPSVSSPRSATASPAPPPGLNSRPSFIRMRSNVISPFTSPRASPRLAHASLQIPHSPRLNNYEFSVDRASSTDAYGDYGSDNVDWLTNDDAVSNASSTYTGEAGYGTPGGEWPSQQMNEMGPYDILRSVFQGEKSDEEIEEVLEANGYDLGAAIMFLMGGQSNDIGQLATGMHEPEKTVLVGKSMVPGARPVTPVGQAKSSVVCRYWLSTGQCLRADCRFSHDLTNHLCKYWLAGNCLAGDSCIFSHDPSALMESMALGDAAYLGSPSFDELMQQNLQIQDYSSFPTLQGSETSLRSLYAANPNVAPPPGFTSRPALAPEFFPSRPQPQATSRQQISTVSSKFTSDDSEAFPTLGSAAGKGGKKHHGKRGHGHSHRDKENGPSSLAELVRASPSPSVQQSPKSNLKPKASYVSSRENSAAAQGIPAPQQIPWLETGDRVNKAYMKARQEAIKHGGARNKFLQSAAQAWNRNDVRAAKALSLRGQSENDLMREAHREAARFLYEERNKRSASDEIYVDLHGLHPAEAVTYLSTALNKQRASSALHRDSCQFLYAIVGTGHHSKSGRDKVGKAIRTFLNEYTYAFKEFSVPGDRGANGGILGIDILSGTTTKKADVESSTSPTSPTLQHGKIRILKASEAQGIGI